MQAKNSANNGRVRVEERDEKETATVLHVSDGSISWQYVVGTKQYSKSSVGLSFGGLGLPPLQWFGARPGVEPQGNPKTVREESIDVDGSKRAAWVVTDGLNAGSLANDTATASITIWIDKEFLIPIKSEVFLANRANPPSTIKLSLALRDLKIDPSIANEAFAFTPPADAKDMGTSASSAPDTTGQPAPPFEAKDLEDKPYNLTSLKGKAILLDFWATWCGPCAASVPALERIHQDLKDKNLVMLSVDVAESRRLVEAFLKPRPLPYPVVMGTEFGLERTFDVKGLPTFIVIDTEGKIAGRLEGYGPSDEAVLRGMLAKTGVGSAPAVTRSGPPKPADAAAPQYVPAAIALDPRGGLIVADFAGGRLIKISGQDISTIATSLSQPAAVAVNSTGDIYVAEAGAGRIRKVAAADGAITAVATVQISRTSALAVDPSGNLFLAGNNRIQKVSADGTVVTVAGTGAPGVRGDGGPAIEAMIAFPTSIAFGSTGTLFLADMGNNRIRKIVSDGTMLLSAGNGSAGFSGDNGIAVLAQLQRPMGLTTDRTGNIYVGDSGNYRIRKVTAAGVITTVVGTGARGYAGDGGPAISAMLSFPEDLVVDAAPPLE